jgi:hypothetical protein
VDPRHARGDDLQSISLFKQLHFFSSLIFH